MLRSNQLTLMRRDGFGQGKPAAQSLALADRPLSAHRWFRTFAMNVSQIHHGDEGEPVEMKFELEKAAN